MKPRLLAALLGQIETFLAVLSGQCRECVVARGSRRCEECFSPRAGVLLGRLREAREGDADDGAAGGDGRAEAVLRRVALSRSGAVRAACIRLPGLSKEEKGVLLSKLVAARRLKVERRMSGGRTAYFYSLPPDAPEKGDAQKTT